MTRARVMECESFALHFGVGHPSWGRRPALWSFVMNLARAVEALQRFALAGVAALLLCAPAGASGSGPLASAAQAESGPTIVHLLDYVVGPAKRPEAAWTLSW
jgi:hypothetical protein